jgi:NADH-quinone oxidoreductase subunit M
MLPATIYLSFGGAALLALWPRRWVRSARWLALAAASAGLACGLGGMAGLGAGAGLVNLIDGEWIPTLGARYHLAADGISLTLVLLTGIASVAGVLFSWNVAERTTQYFAFYLALIGGVYGVFLSFDLLLLFVFYEVAIVPKYFLIAFWGSTRKEYGAMKLALYSFAGSGLALVGILAAYVVAAGLIGRGTFDLGELAGVAFPAGFQGWVFPLVFVGFAVLAGLWPFHSWAPTGHVAAPTAASMLLAGVVMKLGAYGALRVAMALFPLGYRAWQPALATLAVVGIVYGALVALVQRDFKFVVGFSSVSHMGLVLLGLMTFNEPGISGAVLQMFSHGIIAGLLFGVVGRMVYDRVHTRDLEVLGRWRLGRALPFAAATFVLASLAGMGVPGFSGFVAELQVLVGAWRAFPVAALGGGAGIVLGVAYLWRAMQRAFFADRETVVGETAEAGQPLEPVTLPERLGALLLLGAALAVGLYPRLLLDYLGPATQALLEAMRKGGAG